MFFLTTIFICIYLLTHHYLSQIIPLSMVINNLVNILILSRPIVIAHDSLVGIGVRLLISTANQFAVSYTLITVSGKALLHSRDTYFHPGQQRLSHFILIYCYYRDKGTIYINAVYRVSSFECISAGEISSQNTVFIQIL